MYSSSLPPNSVFNSVFKGLSEHAIEKTMGIITGIKENLEKADAEALGVNDQETHLEVEDGVEDYGVRLTQIKKDIEPFELFWASVQESSAAMRGWMGDPLHEVSAEEAENLADNARRQCMKSAAKFETLEGCEEVHRAAKETQKVMDEFITSYWPLLELTSTPGIRQRHWDKVAELTSINLPAKGEDETYTLRQLVDLGLHNHIEKIEETCGGAAKEFTLEKTLDIMEGDWQDTSFGLKEYSKAYMDEGTYMLTSVDEIQLLLDDQIVKTQAMQQSRFIEPFRDRATAWEKVSAGVMCGEGRVIPTMYL